MYELCYNGGPHSYCAPFKYKPVTFSLVFHETVITIAVYYAAIIAIVILYAKSSTTKHFVDFQSTVKHYWKIIPSVFESRV